MPMAQTPLGLHFYARKNIIVDLSDDQLYLDGLLSVTKTDGVTGSTSTINNAIILHVDQLEKEESYGVYQGWVSQIHSLEQLVIGDYIQVTSGFAGDGLYGKKYIVLNAKPPVFSDPYICDILDLAFHRFNNTVTHLRPVFTKDIYANDVLTNYTQVSPPVSARIQPTDTIETMRSGKRIQIAGYNIFILQNLSGIVQGDILQSASGQKYKIVNIKHKASITDLMTVECVADYETIPTP